MATIKKHAANFADHERVDLYRNVTRTMEQISALYDAFELYQCDMSPEATETRVALYVKLQVRFHDLETFATDLAKNAHEALEWAKQNVDTFNRINK